MRRSEWLLVVYFVYVAAFGYWRSGSLRQPATFALAVPFVIAAVVFGEMVNRRVWSVVRDWMPVALVLVAYWSVDLVALPHGDYELENKIVRVDRLLLDDWGLRAAIESSGPIVPAILEAAYLGLYAVLPVTVAVFYFRRERDRIDRFLLPFLVGTLAVYAVLPHYPSEAPRLVFDGIDVPPIDTALRRLNIWILNRWDIRSSVLPSGHVAAALSAALAMRFAIPDRRSISWALVALALLVWVDAVYSRYHYAVDGLAAVAVSGAAIGLWALIDRRSP